MYKTLFMMILLPLVLINSACSNTLNKLDHPDFLKSGEITDKKISEASGLAYSTRNKNVLWTMNDSGGKAQIYAINEAGESLGRIKLKGIKNKDWEDITSFKYKGTSYLLVADVGDNKAKRKKVTLHFIKEPNFKDLSKKSKLKLKPEWSVDFSYEDGPRDCESVAVDVANKKILLLSKRNQPPVLYELPFTKNPKKGKQTAKRIMPVNNLELANPSDIRNLKHITFNGQPTAMDISADGKSAVVLTYLRVYYFHNPQAKNSAALFAEKPHIYELPYLSQAEAISFGANDQAAFITSEGLPSSLLKLDLSSRPDN